MKKTVAPCFYLCNGSIITKPFGNIASVLASSVGVACDLDALALTERTPHSLSGSSYLLEFIGEFITV